MADKFLTSADIEDELVTRLTAIRVGAVEPAGTALYNTDIGARVYRGRRAVDHTQVPCVSIVEADDVVTRQGTVTQYNVGQKFALMAYVACDPDHPNQAAHAVLRDMKRAVFRTAGKPDKYLGSRVNEIKYLGRQIAPREDGQRFLVAILEIEVGYVEDVGS
jgi:hypothetical protein